MPPPARREDVVDVVHGVEIPDPYRWLESGDDPEVTQWVADQNRCTRQALDARPDRGRWHERLSALTSLPTVIGCKLRGDRLFVLERDRSADQFALVLRSATDPTATPRTLLDPASAASDAAVAIDWFQPSPDGSVIALGLSEGGTEESVLRLLDVATGTLGPLQIPNTRAASVAWEHDQSGFWYACYPAGDQYHRHIRHHRIGDDPAADPVVFDELPTDESWPDVSLSPDRRYLLVEVAVGWGRSDVHLLDIATGAWAVVVEGIDAMSGFTFAGDHLVGLTTIDAPNGRIVTASFASPGVESWTTIVAERPDVVLGSPTVVGQHLLHAASRVGVDRVERRTFAGVLVDELDGLGIATVQQIVGADDSSLGFVMVATFDSPVAIWRYVDGATQRWAPDPPSADELPPIVVSQGSYPSLDGTEIGIFMIHRADVTPSPDVPLILNGYGGFAISESPTWVPNIAAWCAEGGVWAVAGLRGGLEHGERWHHAGRRNFKQNVFDDFHAAGDWLVAAGLASHEHLAAVGGSNGGLLVGVALTQRPDLARAVWCAVPLLDMVRFPQFLIARLWTDEFGDPDIAEEFAWLHAYSPYHHVDLGRQYPAVLFSTAEGDTRVDPLHARKMAAAMQWAAAGQDERPVLLAQAGRAGHGVGKPASMRIAEGVDVLSFLSWQLGGPT